MRQLFVLQVLGLLCGLGRGAPSLEAEISPRGLEKRAPTCNTPSNRACWSDGFDINTDYETKIPDTGVTVNVSVRGTLFLVINLMQGSTNGPSASIRIGLAVMDYQRTLPS